MNIKTKYTSGGIAFGLCFPFFETLVWSIQNGISFMQAQTPEGNILIWIIDSAPLVLGCVFYQLGKKAQELYSINIDFEDKVRLKTLEL